jgi:2-dehydro-3-deoxyphosphooctonate aldolase (KDO 8-P synthase)
LYLYEDSLKDFIIIAGPCLAESKEMLDETCSELSSIVSGYDIDFYFKASYKKANRTSFDSYSGAGDESALKWIKEISEKYHVKSITDIHSVDEAKFASNYVDALQIPAFLCRQTELLIASGETGKMVNIKKGQFLAPKDMKSASDKVLSTGNNQIMLTERGTFFGYHDLVVDFRSFKIMGQFGYPVIYDATHSVQLPSIGVTSGGSPEYIESLAKAAVAFGINGIFFETHPNPMIAKSDASTQLPLDKAKDFIKMIMNLQNYLKKN